MINVVNDERRRPPLRAAELDEAQWAAREHTVAFDADELHLARDFAREYVPALRGWLAGGRRGADFFKEFVEPRHRRDDLGDAVQEAMAWRRTAGERLRSLDTAVTTCCNLRCAGCSAAVTFEESWFAEVDQLDRTLARLAELCGDRPPLRYELMGGEPLLHPRIVDLVAVASGRLPATPLHLVTNGLLLPELSDQVLADLAALSCGVSVSVYGPGVYFDRYMFTHGEGDQACSDCAYHAVTLVKNHGAVHHCGHTLAVNGDLYFCGAAPTLEVVGRGLRRPFTLTRGPLGDVWSIFAARSLDQLLMFVNRPTCPMAMHCAAGRPVPWRQLSTPAEQLGEYLCPDDLVDEWRVD